MTLLSVFELKILPLYITKLSFDENVIIKDKDGTSGRIGQGYYNNFSNIDNTVRLNSGTWASFYYGAVTGSTITGNTEYIIDGTANVKAIYVGHGSGTSTQATKGTTKITVNGGTIAIDVGGSQGNMNSLHQGLRYYTLNGGTVSSFYTRSNDTYASYEGITVYEINKGVTITPETIGETSGTTDDSETRVVIFNDGFDAIPVGDTGAYVLDVTGANLSADVTVASDYTATLNGYTYELADDSYDAVKIGDKEIKLDTLTNGVIPASEFQAGVNTVEFKVAEAEEPELAHIAAYRDAGYEIIYVAGKDLRSSVAANTAAGKKVVFALKDDLNLTGSLSLDNNGATFVITSAGGNINLGTCSISLGTDKDADITFDHIALSKTSGERGINAVGNNLTLTETVTVSSGKDNIFYINAAGDGGDPAKPSKGNTITIETPSKVSVRGAGYSGNYTNGNVNFVFGKNAQAYLTAAGKVGNDNQPDTKGNITVTVKDNAKLLEFTLAEGKSFLTGNLDVTIKDNATVGTITGAKYAIKFNGNLGKATPSADYATIALTPAATAKYVRVTNGDTVKEYNVAGEEVDLLADLSALALSEGATTVEFLADGTEAPKTADYTIETYTMGTDGAYGEAVTETKTAEVGTTVTIEPEEKTGFTISTGSTLSGTVTADGLLTLAVYYDRNSYKLYTKADAEAEAVVAGTYYYEEALTAPATPEKDGYTFKAWDPTVPATMPANDVTLTATWEKNAPTTATLKFYDGDTLFVEKTVAIGATLDILPLMSDVKGGNHATYANDILARPAKKGYKLVGWATTNGGEAVTVTANADASYYAVWEEVNELTAGEDFTLTIVDGTEVTASPVPADAISFIRGDDKNSFGVNSDGVKYYDTTVTDLSAYGVSFVAGKTGIGSWYGGSDTQKTVLCPDGTKSIWYKWNDSYISAKPGVEGEYNVAYWIYTGSEGSTRAFTLDAPGKSGVVYLNGAGTKDHFVQFKATLTADSELKYSAALDFDDNTVKGAQLLGIYIWKDAPVVTTANATFNANGGAWGEETTKVVETVIGETPVAPANPERAGYTFAGWEPALAAMVADGATYTAKWEVIVRTFENAVYLGNAGNDDNDGLTPATLVKTLKRAQAIVLANEDIDTIVVVGTYSKSNESSSSTNDFLKGANRKITITGQTVESVFDMKYGSSDSHLRLGNDIEFNNLKMNASSGDGGIMSMGYELTFGEGMTINSQKAGFLHYNAQLKDNGVVNVYSGTIGRLDIGVQSGQTWRGTSTINVYGGAVGVIRNGHGWKGNQAVYGINNVNVNGGSVGYINMGSSADTAVTNYSGLRYFTINDGTVGDITITGSSVSKKYAKLDSNNKEVKDEYGNTIMLEQTASVRAGVTVVEYNGGTIGTIKLGTNKQTGADDPDDATRVVILNNNKTANVTDADAIVVKAIGGALKASVTMADDYTATLEGYTFTTDKAYVRINGTEYAVSEFVSEAALTAEEVSGVIPADELTAGYNSVLFTDTALITVNWTVDGETVKTDSVEAGSTVTAPEAPAKDGYTFKGWAIEGTTEIIDTFTFTTSTTLVAVFEEIPEPEETAIYKTYGVYDEETGTYTVELKISGVKAHMGSFGFVLPGLVSVTAAEGITLFAEEAAAGAVVSPIFAKGEDFYANTWAIEAAPGYIDATAEEVLIATFVLEADASFPEKFEEYVVDLANAKYFAGGHYLVAPKFDALDTDKIAVIYESHTDSIKEIEVPELEYKTYGTYNPADGSYTIEVKFIGGKINAGAFGIEFNSDYMTYDPEADGAFVLADGIANYLGLALENTADGIAFVWDGSADAENGFVDATDAEVLIATIKTTMTEDQRAVYEAAGAPAFALLDISGVEDSDKYFDGTDYLVSVYADDLAIDRVPASYTAHADEAVEITTADVTVKVTFADKAGATSVNLGYITVNGREPVVIDAEGNEEATVEYVINGANVGETLTIKVEKNGYLTAEAEVKVSAAGNTVEITTVAGDIKESTEAICGNGEIELSDFIRVVRAFDESATDAYKTTVDLDENGAVNVTDLGIVKANFSKTAADVTVEVK